MTVVAHMISAVILYGAGTTAVVLGCAWAVVKIRRIFSTIPIAIGIHSDYAQDMTYIGHILKVNGEEATVIRELGTDEHGNPRWLDYRTESGWVGTVCVQDINGLPGLAA